MRKISLIIFVLLLATSQMLRSQTNQLFEDKQIIIENADTINTAASDLGPVIIDNELMFNSFVPSDGKGKDDQSFYDVFTSDIDNNGNIVSGRHNMSAMVTEYHEGPLSYCEATGQLFLTQSNWQDPEEINIVFKKKNIRLGIVIYEKRGLGWQYVEKFPYNSNQFSVAHPAINKTGDTLVFVSDMPGSVGESDLYYSVKKDNQWSTPVNLGNKVNTAGKEMFPFLTDDNLLIFASNGHPGKGGLDLYYTKFKVPLTGELVSFSGEINSEADDFGFVIAPNKRFGFFSSNREGGKGDDDIYSVKLQEFKFELLTVSSYDETVISNADIEIYDMNNKLIMEGVTDDEGKLALELEVNKKYEVVAIADGYMEANQEINLTGDGTFVNQVEKVYLDPSFRLDGEVVDILGNLPIPDALVVIEKDGEFSDSIYADYQGKFSNYIEPDHDYRVIISATNYFGTEVNFSTADMDPGVLDYYFQLYSLNAGTRINLKNIYYDLAKWDIRPDAARELDRLVSILEEYPDIQIRLESHTDSRGGDDYNMDLSQKRALTAYEYLVNHGIDPDRVEYVGFGESQLVNECDDGVNCTEEQHAENRRTVVEILQSKATRRSKGNIYYF
ncbi:OmpA family protein [Sunxiuqinia sp. A32]|uniref:OmpA family protein n=1 Tax=Sunxiuqinia sp. A32 TaxID=3461496 RepID=UPI0040465967